MVWGLCNSCQLDMLDWGLNEGLFVLCVYVFDVSVDININYVCFDLICNIDVGLQI